MALFITRDTLFHNQKYLLALVLKVKLTLPQPTAPQPPPIKRYVLHPPIHTPKMPTARQIDCQRSYYKACYVTEAEGSLRQVTFNAIAREVVMKQK